MPKSYFFAQSIGAEIPRENSLRQHGIGKVFGVPPLTLALCKAGSPGFGRDDKGYAAIVDAKIAKK